MKEARLKNLKECQSAIQEVFIYNKRRINDYVNATGELRELNDMTDAFQHDFFLNGINP